MSWTIIQFSKDNTRYRRVSKAYQDGYPVGDRMLEDCDFEVRITGDGSVEVKATLDVRKYLEGDLKANVAAWEADVLDFVKKCGDTLHLLGDPDPVWDNQELHLIEDTEHFLSAYKEQGMTEETQE